KTSTWSTSAISASTTTTTRGPHRTESPTRPRTMSWFCWTLQPHGKVRGSQWGSILRATSSPFEPPSCHRTALLIACHRMALHRGAATLTLPYDYARPMQELDQDHPADHLLEHVPGIDLPFDGNYRHANGLDLPVIVINLPRRVDRWETLCRRMNAAGLTRLIKAPAIDGTHLPEAQIVALMGSHGKNVDEAPRSHLSLTRPAVGCFLSHLAIWRRLIDENLPRALILEDDAAPTAMCSAETLQSALAFMPDDAGLVFPGLIIMGGLADRSTVSGLARIYYFNGTFAYFVTPAMCQSLLRHLLPLRSHIDHQISCLLVEQRHAFPACY